MIGLIVIAVVFFALVWWAAMKLAGDLDER